MNYDIKQSHEIIKVRVNCNAARSRVIGLMPDFSSPSAETGPVVNEQSLRVHLSATPENGEANEALIKLLAQHFGVNKGAISILNGEFSKNKTIRIDTSKIKRA